MEAMSVIIVTQARVGSSRLPRKVLLTINGQTLLDIHLERLKKSKMAERIIVATTFEDESEKIVAIAENQSVDVFQGSTDDVLDRFYCAVKPYRPRFVVRVTSDCPLIDPALVDSVIEMVQSEGLDYGANILQEMFPDGQDVEVFTFEALEKAWAEAKLVSEREHVTPFIRNNTDYKGGKSFKAKNLNCPENYNHIRMTVDEPSDLEAMEVLINDLGLEYDWEKYVEHILKYPEKFRNQQIIRNEGYLKSMEGEK